MSDTTETLCEKKKNMKNMKKNWFVRDFVYKEIKSTCRKACKLEI